MATTSWPPWAIRSLERQLDTLHNAVRANESRPDDEQIWLTRFLVVRACGYLEQVVHETVTGFVQDRSGGEIRAFAMSWFNKSRNPSPDNLVEMVGRFDERWKHEFESLLDSNDGGVRQELNLLVSRRNQIAHGLNEGLNTRKAIEMVDLSKQIADWFILRFNPSARNRT